MKDVKIWYDDKSVSFNLEGDYDFLYGKTVEKIRLNSIPRNKSMELQKLLSIIIPAFLTPYK